MKEQSFCDYHGERLYIMQSRDSSGHAGGQVSLPGLCRVRDMAVRALPRAQQRLRLSQVRIHGAMKMGEVAVTLRLIPESADVDLAHLEADIKSRVKVHSVSREPIAFGLEALRVVAVVQDAAGGTEPLERELSTLAGVGNVQVIDVRRLL